MAIVKNSVTRKRSVTRKIGKKRVGKRSVVSKAVKNYVKRTISSRVEDKIWVDYGTNQSITTCSGGSTPTHRQLLPSLVQGLQAGQRLGNEVFVKSAIIRGTINLANYNATTNPGPVPAYILMLLVKNKKANVAMGSSNAGSDILDTGNNAIGFQGNMLDIILPTNRQNWQEIARRKVKLGFGYGTANNFYDNSAFAVPFFFNYGKHLKKLQYEDTGAGFTQTIPVNTNMALIFQPVYANGDTSGQYVIAEYHYAIKMVYEDA